MLIVEDGTGVLNANSYVTVEEADAFCNDRLILAWDQTDEATKVAKLIEACDYMAAAYTWIGESIVDGQSTSLPTTAVLITRRVKYAQILLGVEALKGPLMPSAVGPFVTKERKKLDGVGEKEFEYESGTTGVRRFPSIDGLLKGLYVSAVNSSFQSARILLG